jgi:hypothetical protein
LTRATLTGAQLPNATMLTTSRPADLLFFTLVESPGRAA